MLGEYFSESKARTFVPGLINSQLPIVHGNMGFFDWLEISLEYASLALSRYAIFCVQRLPVNRIVFWKTVRVN